ncbi:MAG TPA: dTDP-4-dehydrorhamnose 3,5-epimerase [bacterium]|nr:dTDP-4-dehydrorhamnose 3,5-epimerase [bacterium]
MKVTPTRLKEVLLVQPDVFRDDRGFFLEFYHEARFREAGIAVRFVQDNHSRSERGTLRGLHGQLRKAQAKLVRVIVGEVFDVAVDVRPGSPTFGQWVGETLSAQTPKFLYIPPGFLHGFCVLSPEAELEYKCSEFYDRGDEVGVRWNDPDLAIDWPVRDPLLSTKDRNLPAFKDAAPLFEVYRSK